MTVSISSTHGNGDDKATDMASYTAINEAGNCPEGVRFMSQQLTHGTTLAAISNNSSKLKGSAPWIVAAVYNLSVTATKTQSFTEVIKNRRYYAAE